MLTINTHIIKRGSVKEKIKNFLEKVYNPKKAQWMKDYFEKIQKIRRIAVYYHNEYSDSLYIKYPDSKEDLPVLFYESLPEIITEETQEKDKIKTIYHFKHTEKFTEGDEEKEYTYKVDVTPQKGVYKVFLCLKKNVDGNYDEFSCVNMLCIPEIGFVEINDENFIKKSSSFHKDDGVAWGKLILDKKEYARQKLMTKKYEFIYNIGYNIYKFCHTIDSIILCIRFPFLYPRNRFTDHHYNNWKLADYTKKLANKANLSFYINYPKDERKIMVLDSLPEVSSEPAFKNSKLLCWYFNHNGQKIIVRDKASGKRELFRCEVNGKLCDYAWDEKHGWINLTNADNIENGLNFDHDDYVNKYYNIVFSKWTNIYIKLVNFYHFYILGLFHFIPTSNELDALDEGWMRKFGIALCKDIRKQLIKDKQLFSFRIEQIKEKFGTLHFYTGPCSKEIYEIINKYENISYSTCICCGEPAKYITRGWICPYCENCIDDNSKASARLIGAEETEDDNNEE